MTDISPYALLHIAFGQVRKAPGYSPWLRIAPHRSSCIFLAGSLAKHTEGAVASRSPRSTHGAAARRLTDRVRRKTDRRGGTDLERHRYYMGSVNRLHLEAHIGSYSTGSYRRLCQLRTIRIVRTRAKIGGNGKANPHQKIAPAGTNTRPKVAPAL